MNKTVTPGDLHGELRVLPSKSASHRAVMMAALARGKTLLLATSKPTVFARQILAHYGLDRYFALIGGSNMDNTRSHKNEVIEYVLETCGLQDRRGECVMIGDRRFDIEGAAAAGVESIGVLWGYGSREELEKASPGYLAADIPELRRLLA